MKKDFIIGIIIFLLIVFVFRDLSHTFYQQDEWHALGFIKAQGISYVSAETSIIELLTLENRPLARFANVFLFGHFPLAIFPLFIFVIIFHFLNSFLLYKIIQFFIKKRFAAILATLFFTFNATSRQAVLWFGTVTSSLPSAFGVLGSILFYLYYLEQKKQKYLIISLFFLIFSLFFKETGLFLFIMFPLASLLHTYSLKRKFIFKKSFFIFLGLASIFFILKFSSAFFLVENTSRYVASSNTGTNLRLIWAAISYPIESISQIFFPGEIFFPFSRKITEIAFPYFESSGNAGIISETIGIELISLFVSMVFVTILTVFLLVKKKKWPLIFSILFYFLSFIPYIVLKKPNGYLESRYYYLAVAPISLMLGILLSDLINFFSLNTKKRKLKLFIVFILIYSFYLSKNISFINDQIDFLKERALTQNYILSEIVKLHPEISTNQVFFIESDHDFIVANNPLPFQNGIGYTLLATYAYKNNTDKLNPFLTDNYFWKLGNQGYFEKEGQGFGFFTNIKELQKEIAKGKIKADYITALKYNSEKNTIKDITAETKKKLKKE